MRVAFWRFGVLRFSYMVGRVFFTSCWACFCSCFQHNFSNTSVHFFGIVWGHFSAPILGEKPCTTPAARGRAGPVQFCATGELRNGAPRVRKSAPRPDDVAAPTWCTRPWTLLPTYGRHPQIGRRRAGKSTGKTPCGRLSVTQIAGAPRGHPCVTSNYGKTPSRLCAAHFLAHFTTPHPRTKPAHPGADTTEARNTYEDEPTGNARKTRPAGAAGNWARQAVAAAMPSSVGRARRSPLRPLRITCRRPVGTPKAPEPNGGRTRDPTTPRGTGG